MYFIIKLFFQDGRPVFGVEVGEVYGTLDHSSAWPPQHHHHTQPKRLQLLKYIFYRYETLVSSK